MQCICAIGVAQKAHTLKTVVFYGSENPQENPGAPQVVFTHKQFPLSEDNLFTFDSSEADSPPSPDARRYFLRLQYTRDSSRFIVVYCESFLSDIQIYEHGSWWTVPAVSDQIFYNFMRTCFMRMGEENDFFWGENQSQISLLKEDSLLARIEDLLYYYAQNSPRLGVQQDSIVAWGSAMIYRHLMLYEKYYNFKKIRITLLGGLRSLAQTLKAHNLPVHLRHSGIVYQPQFRIMLVNDRWVCYVGDCLVASHMIEAYEAFNQATE